MIEVTIRFGGTNEVKREFNEGTRVSEILSNSGLKAVLGYGDNVQAVIDGTVQSPSTRLEDGDLVIIEVKANQKASN